MKLPLEKYYRWFFVIGFLIFIIPTALHAYWLMPFPGSQDLEVMENAYLIEKLLLPLQISGILFMIGPVLKVFLKGSFFKRMIVGLAGVVCFIIFYYSSFEYSAEEMFKEPSDVEFSTSEENKVPLNNVILGLVQNGEVKAYPLNYVGYHHKIQDSIGGKPVLITYCTMCRSARMYDPVLNGKKQTFRLVGARHYNAIIEDQETKSWWYQATGEAAAGPLKGSRLKEIDFEQSTLAAWLDRYPNSLILQPDTLYSENYERLKNYDKVRKYAQDSLYNDTLPMKWNNWVVAIKQKNRSKVYNWEHVLKYNPVNDTIGNMSVVVALEKDSLSLHTWNREVNGKVVEFEFDSAGKGLRDINTKSLYTWQGKCIEGPDSGQQLKRVASYQEFWSSWETFNKNITAWKPKPETDRLKTGE